ncbi:MAG: carboxypeptidase-like regulatory domain-containing protein [Bacteroidales bacterium]|nr:carboxypeptidase-like regulatory domain-containing protein [Bacteroidales bacterium]
MNVIANKDLNNVRYMLGSAETAKGFYNQIKATFPSSDEYKIFAEPIIMEGGLKIAWSAEYEGKGVCYDRLTEEDQSIARNILSESIKKLIDKVKLFNDDTITDFMYKCIEIPGMNSVYMLRKNGDTHVVLTEWGFVLDTPGAEKGLLNKLINTRKIPMRFQVVYNDDMTPAPFEDIIFEYEGKNMSAKSDENGVIVLEKIKEDSYIKAFEPDGDQKINMQGFTCYEEGQYQIKVTPKGNMLFEVTDQNHNVLSGQEFIFEYNTEKVKGVSDAEGHITINKVKNGVTVKAYQEKDGAQENINTFISDRKVEKYPIVIVIEEVVETPPPPPETRNMRFKVVDEKNNIVKSAAVTVKYNGITKTLMTDENGYAELQDVPLGTQVEVKAKK